MTGTKVILAVSTVFFLAACEDKAMDAMAHGDDAMGDAAMSDDAMMSDGAAMANDKTTSY